MYEVVVSSKRKQVATSSNNRSRRMAATGFTCNGLILALTMCLAVLALLIQNSGNPLVECQEHLTVESRQQKDKDLTETIDYLEKLDKYFSQIARPRFGRSGGDSKRPLMSRFGGQPMRGSFEEPAQFGSLIELVNNRLAKKYWDSMNY